MQKKNWLTYSILLLTLFVSSLLYALPTPTTSDDLWLTSQEFGMDGPVSITTEYSRTLGMSVDTIFHSLVTPYEALVLEFTGGENEYRIAGTLGQRLTAHQRIKLTAEQLEQKLEFSFDTGDTKQWIKQNAAGVTYEYLFNQGWLNTLDINGYYAKADSKQLSSITYTSGISTYENFRRIAGGTAAGFSAGTDIYPTHLTHLQVGASYDRVKFHRKYENDTHHTEIGQYFSLDQLITHHFKLNLFEKTSALYHQTGGGIYWLLNTMPGTRLELGLKDSYTFHQPDLRNDNRIMLQANYSWNGNPLAPQARYEDFENQTHSSLLSWTGIPAVHMPYVLAKRDQHSPVRSTTIYIAQVPSWAWHASVGAYYEFNLETLILAPIDGGPLQISLVGTLPSGLTYNSTTHILSGYPASPSSHALQAQPLTIEACNTKTCANPRDFSINVAGFKPTITPIPTSKQFAEVGKPYILNLKQYVPAPIGGGPLTITLTGTLPDGLHFDKATSIISGTPTKLTNNPGPTLTIHASNLVGAATPESFPLTIQGTVPIIHDIPLALQHASINKAYSLNLNNYVTGDTRSGPVTITLKGTLPNGITYNASSHVLSGTPTTATNGTPATLTIEAHNDAGDAIPKNFHISVLKSQPSIAAIPAEKQRAFVGHAYSLDLKHYIPAPLDGGNLVVNIEGNLPTGLTFNPTNDTISGTPTAETNGTAPTLTITAKNDYATATPQTFHIQVYNLKPIIAPIPAEKESTFLNQPYELDLKSYVQAPILGGPLAITLQGQLPAGLTYDSQTEILSGTPTAPSNTTLTIEAHNRFDTADPRAFQLHVQDPTPVIDDIPTAATTTSVSFAYSLNLKRYITSPTDAGPVVITLQGSLPPGLTFNHATGVISGTPSAITSANITIHAQNNFAQATPKQIAIRIMPPTTLVCPSNGPNDSAANIFVGKSGNIIVQQQDSQASTHNFTGTKKYNASSIHLQYVQLTTNSYDCYYKVGTEPYNSAIGFKVSTPLPQTSKATNPNNYNGNQKCGNYYEDAPNTVLPSQCQIEFPYQN